MAHHEAGSVLQGFRWGHREARDDKTLAFNAFKDSCPSLTKKRAELFKGCDYRDIERRNDKTLAFNAFKDPCPWLTMKQVQFCKGFDEDIERRETTRLWPSMPSRTLALRSPRRGLSSARDSMTGT